MKRREFAKLAGLSALAIQSFPAAVPAMAARHGSGASLNVPLGICNHTLRALKPNASELIEYAAEHRLDSVHFNTLSVFESFEDDYLKAIKKLAKTNDISIYMGVGSICESSPGFSRRYGDARTILSKGIQTARALGSPIVGVRIGNLDDRYTEGGIEPKIEEVVKLMRSMREPVLDAGIKFAFENHAGDMRSDELLDLIHATGTGICGALYDPGNAVYALEDPQVALEKLGKNIINSTVRDVMIWATEDGASFQWTAIGEGLTDFKHFTKYFSEHCPGVPIQVETISNSPRSLPYLTPEFWDGFPDLTAGGIVDFLKLVRKGHPVEVAKVPAGTGKKEFDIENQKSEFLKSVRYLRKECGAGLKNQYE